MSRVAMLFTSLLLLVAPAVRAQDWVAIVKDMDAKIPRLEMRAEEGSGGVCSAVVYRVDPDRWALALTAAHCVRHDTAKRFDITVNRHHAEVILQNTLLDLAVVQFRASKEQAITRAPDPPQRGTPVAILGYAFGIESVAAQFGHVSQTVNRETKAIWVNADLIFGDSGGAVIDAQGRLVGINSRIYSAMGVAHMAAAVTIEEIEEFIDAADRALAKQRQ